MLPVAFERELLIGALYLAVDPHPEVSFAVQVFYQLLVGALFLPDHRGEDGNGPGHLFPNGIRDPFRGLRLDPDVVHRAVCGPDPGEEES